MVTIIQIAKEILSKNPKCMLSGSLALNLQGIKTRNDPRDIDIYLPYFYDFNSLNDMYENPYDDHKYPTAYWKRISFVYSDNIIVDVFTPNSDRISKLNIGKTIDGITCVEIADIIKFKIVHSLGNNGSRNKQMEDVLYLLNNN